MSNKKESEKTSDKMIDQFKDKAEDSVDDARHGETDDNPLKETVRNNPRVEENENTVDEGKDHG